jgi:hypothetical protein
VPRDGGAAFVEMLAQPLPGFSCEFSIVEDQAWKLVGVDKGRGGPN